MLAYALSTSHVVFYLWIYLKFYLKYNKLTRVHIPKRTLVDLQSPLWIKPYLTGFDSSFMIHHYAVVFQERFIEKKFYSLLSMLETHWRDILLLDQTEEF